MKMRMYTLPKRLIAMLLSIVLVLSVMPSLNATAKVVENSAKADPSSMGTWQDAFMPNGMPSTEHAGGIWTDKSVFTQAGVEAAFDGLNLTVGKDNFLVALSALGSNSIVVGQGTQPTDTVFVLDISGSMDNTAMSAMVTAANNAIRTLMENDDNRVGVVLYSSANKVTTLLPLDHYTGVNMYGYGVEHYFTYSSSGDEISTYIQSSAPSDGGGGCGGDDDQPSQQAAYAYPVGQGNGAIKFGGNDNDAKDPIKCDGGTYIQGGLWEAWENNFKDASDTDNRTPSIVLMSDGAPTYTTNQFDAVPNNNTHGAGDDSYIGDGFVTQLTAAVVKELIDAKYPDAPAYMYTVGFGIDDIDNDDEKAIAAAVLDPTGSAHTDINDLWDTYGKLGPNGTMTVRLGSGNGTSSATVTKSATAVTSQYVDKYFSADSSSDLNDAFQNIVNEISLQAGYYPTRTDDNGTNYSGYVTFSDTIGSGMEVENVKGILVGDELYTGRDMAYVIWATDQNNNHGGNYSITLGTKKEPTALGDEFVRAVKARFGITAATTEEANNIAWELIGNAWENGQLRYDPNTEEFSNYIGWYGDANGDYVAPYPSATVPANAEYINFCYGMLGTTTATSLASDMMYITVQVSQKIATQEQMVTFQIPASLLPVITYKIDVELETDGSIKENTAKISSTTANPVQLLYEVGVNEELVNELTIKDYGKPTGNGRYYLYTNAWDIDADGSLENPASNNYTYAYFEPSHDNQHYYFTEDTLIYADQNGTLYNDDAAPTGTVYYKHTVYHATGTPTDGKYSATVDTEYVQIVGDALASAKQNTDGTWYIPEDTMHANTHSHDLYKTNAPAGDKNHLGNLTETYNMVRNQIVDAAVSREAGTHHYELMYLGNNGRLIYAPATGITLTKELVDGVTAPAGTKFEFTITLTGDTDGSVSVDGVTTAHSGTLNVELEAGETVTITNIADNATFSIVETEQRGFKLSNVTVNGVTKADASGTVTANTLTPVVFTNDDVEYSFFTVSKQVTYNGGSAAIANKLATFTATVTLTNADNTPYANEEVSVGSGKQNTDADGKLQISIKDGQIIRIADVPVGTKYQVDEITTGLPAGYAVVDGSEEGTVVETGNGVILRNQYTPDPIIVDDNNPPIITISGSKTVVGANGTPVAWGSDHQFKAKLMYYDHADMEWKDAPASDHQILDDTMEEGTPSYTFKITKTFSEVGDYLYRVVELADVTLEAEGVTFDTTHHDFRIKVTDDLSGQLKLEVQQVDASVAVTGPGSTGNWDVAADFTNIFALNDATLALSAKKEMTGRELIDGEFEFILEAVTTGAPMPTTATSYSVKSGKGDGHNADIVFPAIVYTHNHFANQPAGGYVYKLSEKNGGTKDKGVSYDNAEYTITVTLTENGGKVVATPTYAKEGVGTITAADVVFRNTYTADSVTVNALTAVKTLTDLTPGAAVTDLTSTIKAGDYGFKLTYVDGPQDGSGNRIKPQFIAGSSISNWTNDYLFPGVQDGGAVDLLGEKDLYFTKTGIYVFKAEEWTVNVSGVTKDTAVYTITIDIKDDGAGNLYVDSTSYLLNGTTPVNADKVVFANTYKAEATGEIKLGGTKGFTVAAGKNLNRVLADGDFTFILSDKAGNEIERVTNVGNTFQFTSLNFDREGTYEYVITELNDGKGGVSYDGTSYAVKIVVSDDTTPGQLTAVTTVGGNDVADDKNISVEFRNSYDVTDATLLLRAHKHLDGRPMVHDEFKFKLKALNNAPMPDGYNVQDGVANGYRGLIDFGKITYTKVGTYEYTIEETAGADDIGVTYDATKYTVTVTVIDNGEGALEAAITKVMQGTTELTDDKQIQFYNRYEADEVTVNITGGNDADGIKNLTDLSSTTDKTLDDFVLEFILKDENGVEIETVKDNGSGFNFADITYHAPTTVVYWIEEVAGDIPGMTYDTTKYKVTVTVTDNLTGKLVADVVYEKVTDAGTAPATKVEFNNTYKAKETTVTFQGLKTFTGGRDLKENEFSFTLAALNGAPMGVTGSTETVKNAADGKFTFSAITFTEEGEYAYELTEVKGDDKQVTYDPAKYTLTVTVTDVNGELKATTVVTKDNKSAEDYGFTNVFAPSSASVDIAVQKVLKNESGKEMGLKGFKFRLVGVEKTGTATAESNDKGEAKFTLTFTAEDIGKTFTYKLSEVDTEVADVTYDETVYEIKVAVGQNKTTGELILTVTSNGKVMEKAAEFVNTYAPAPEKEPEKEPEKDPEKTPEKDPDESPKTMDDFRIGNWLLMMSVGAVCLLAVIVLGKKKFEI